MLVELSVMDQRYQAVMEVLRDGLPVIEVAERYVVARQTVHNWVRKYKKGGVAALADQSHRPKSCPHQISKEIEERIFQMRRWHPHWGPRRIVHELSRRGTDPLPNRSSVYRALVRRGQIEPVSRRKRKKDYRRWERSRSMELWQFDVMKIKLVDGTKVSVVTGIDDHSRFCVSAMVVKHATSRSVCRAFAEALKRYGIPEEVLTDNGIIFTGRFSASSNEVLFDRICRDNGIHHILTSIGSPTTTGKIERFHKTLRRELFATRQFATIAEAQRALDRFIEEYNYSRPHQSISMMTPAERFKAAEHRETKPEAPSEPRVRPDVAALEPEHSVELARKVGIGGTISVANTIYRVGRRFTGTTITVRFDRNLLHVFDGDELIAALPRRHMKEVKNLRPNKAYTRKKAG